VAADVCKCLALSNPSKAYARLDAADMTMITLTRGEGKRGNPNAKAVTEAGLYDLVLQSRVPGAEVTPRPLIL
jgi:prophage antirepressor-like protein